MAEVQYKSEPTVSVHGMPQSQYNAQQGGGTTGGGGGLIGNIKQHWPVWSVGIGIATIAIMFLMWRGKQNTSIGTASTGAGCVDSNGNPVDCTASGASAATAPGALWGSQLDSDYQQMISTQNANTGVLQQILTALQTPTSPGTGGSGGGGGGGGGGIHWPLPFWQKNPIVPQGQFNVSNPQIGQVFNFGGIAYQLDPGPDGRIWGVPEVGGKALTKSQVMSTPIGTGTGQKELLSAPSSYYHQ